MNLADNKVKGFLFVMITCFTYGMMPALTQLSYKAGLSVDTMLFGRLTLGAVFIWITILTRKLQFKVEKKHLGFMLLTGCASVVQMITMSESYRFLPGAIVSLLMFLYSSVVVVIEILIGRDKFNKARIICLLCSFAGMVLVIWTPGEGVQLNGIGIALALTAALFYGLYAIGLGEKRTRALDSEVVIGYMLIPPIFFSLIRILVTGEPILPQTSQQGMYVFLLAFFCMFVAAVSFCKGVKYIGSSNAAIINTFEPVVAYFAGILLMDDKVSFNAILGGVLILGAIIYLNLKKPNAPVASDLVIHHDNLYKNVKKEVGEYGFSRIQQMDERCGSRWFVGDPSFVAYLEEYGDHEAQAAKGRADHSVRRLGDPPDLGNPL